MNELSLEYSTHKKHSVLKKRILLSFGLVILVGGLAVLVGELINHWTNSLIISSIANIFLGVYFIMLSVDHRLLHEEKFIRISSAGIEYKLGNFYKEVRFGWDQVSELSSSKRSLQFTLQKNKKVILKMIHFPSSDEKRIRAAIDLIAANQYLTRSV